MQKLVADLGALTIITALTACGGGEAPPPSSSEGVVRPVPVLLLPAGVHTPTPGPTVAPAAVVTIEVTPGSYDGVEITRAQFGDQWPFNVESGVAECEHRNRTPMLRVGKVQYPLTGRRMFALADPFDIWLDDPDNPGSKMSLEPITAVAITQCDQSRLEAPGGAGAGGCLAAGTAIDTPNGYVTVADLRVGIEVWTVDASGTRVSVAIHKVAINPAPEGHHMVDVVLDDGRRLLASPSHPLADGRTLREVVAGDEVDGAQVISTQLIGYGESLYDILPAGDTGHYWANEILLGSTISSPLGCRSDK